MNASKCCTIKELTTSMNNTSISKPEKKNKPKKKKPTLTEFINNLCGNKNWNMATKKRHVDLDVRLPSKWNVENVYEIMQPYMFASFILRKKEYSVLKKPSDIKPLYHITKRNCIPSILNTNLDWRMVHRMRYGLGVSFTDDIYYALQNSSANTKQPAIIIADVLMGDIVTRKSFHKVRTVSIDTGLSVNKKVYVKARDDKFYPRYVVYSNIDINLGRSYKKKK